MLKGPSNGVKNEEQDEALIDKGMSKSRAARIANVPKSSSHGGQKSGSGGRASRAAPARRSWQQTGKGGKAAATRF